HLITTRYTAPISIGSVNTATWPLYRNTTLGIRFRHPPHTTASAVLVNRSMMHPCNGTDSPRPRFSYIEVDVSDEPHQSTEPQSYSFRVSFRSLPATQDCSSELYVSAFPGDPINLDSTTSQIEERLKSIFVDVAY